MATQDEINRVLHRIATRRPRPAIINALAYYATHPLLLLGSIFMFGASALAEMEPSSIENVAALGIAVTAGLLVRYWTSWCSTAELRLLARVADEDAVVGPYVRAWLDPSLLPSVTEYHLVEQYLTLRDGKPPAP